jgi:hypothetical protein
LVGLESLGEKVLKEGDISESPYNPTGSAVLKAGLTEIELSKYISHQWTRKSAAPSRAG